MDKKMSGKNRIKMLQVTLDKSDVSEWYKKCRIEGLKNLLRTRRKDYYIMGRDSFGQYSGYFQCVDRNTALTAYMMGQDVRIDYLSALYSSQS